jgi:hypothetical protein
MNVVVGSTCYAYTYGDMPDDAVDSEWDKCMKQVLGGARTGTG